MKVKTATLSLYAIFAILAHLSLTGCATQSTIVERKSSFGSVGGGRGGGVSSGYKSGIVVEVYEDGLRYKGETLKRENLVKRIKSDDLEESPQKRNKNSKLPQIVSRPVHLVEKDDMPFEYMESLRKFFIDNNITNAIIVGHKTGIAYTNDDEPEPLPTAETAMPKLRRNTTVRR